MADDGRHPDRHLRERRRTDRAWPDWTYQIAFSPSVQITSITVAAPKITCYANQ